MPREHGADGTYVETVPVDRVLDVFDDVDGPVILSADVADALGCTRETARRKLQALHDRGVLDRRKVSRRVIYWRAEDAARDADTVDTTQTPPEDGTRDTRPTRAESDPLADVVEDLPGTVDPADARDAIAAAREYLRENGPAPKAAIVREVMPSHALGYDVDAAREKLDAPGGRFRGAWWRRVVKPGLEAFDDVATPAPGASDWRVTREGRT